MRIALGSDESTELTRTLERELRARGHDVSLYGALRDGDDDSWPAVGRSVGEAVARGDCAQGIVCCSTGTGVSIAANKVAGVRAALCADAEIAAGARTWNDANVLALSLLKTPAASAGELLDAWFSTGPTGDPAYRRMIDQTK